MNFLNAKLFVQQTLTLLILEHSTITLISRKIITF